MTQPIQPQPPPPPKPFTGLTIGRVVHFVLADGPGRGQHRPAFVTSVVDAEAGIVNLNVFRDIADLSVTIGAASFLLPKVKFSAAGAEATWHWPERAE